MEDFDSTFVIVLRTWDRALQGHQAVQVMYQMILLANVGRNLKITERDNKEVRTADNMQMWMQPLAIISGYLFDELLMMLTHVVEFVWLCICACCPKNFRQNSQYYLRNKGLSRISCKYLPQKLYQNLTSKICSIL